eukprot:72248-Chlamydomonas_euryale.AAC.1
METWTVIRAIVVRFCGQGEGALVLLGLMDLEGWGQLTCATCMWERIQPTHAELDVTDKRPHHQRARHLRTLSVA